MKKTILNIQNLSKNYNKIQAVQDISFDVQEQMVFGILGPNGSGKTTTLGMLLGVVRPKKGTFSWFGNGMHDANRKRIGSLLETPNFYPYLTAAQNLKIVSLIKCIKNPKIEIDRVLKLVGLIERKDSKFKTYSLGMKQRLAIASVLLGDPEVLVLDEPTNGLDPQGIAEIRDLIMDIGKKGKTIIIASHILDEIEKICTHCVILKNGKLIKTGTINEIIGNEDEVLLKVASADLMKLRGYVAQHPHIFIYKDLTDCLVVRVGDGLSPVGLNQLLFDNGIVLSELMVYNETLERQFLEIIKQS